jgi:hypothetical protein
MDDWQASVRLACQWVTEISLIRTREHGMGAGTGAAYAHFHRYSDWRGAFRGEYYAATGKWDVYCPVWHGGQGIKALTMAYSLLRDSQYLDSARFAADFIMRHRKTDPADEDYGLILAYENAFINTTAILESLDGLFVLSEASGDSQYANAALLALSWVTRKAFRPDEGMFHAQYDVDQRSFLPPYFDEDREKYYDGNPDLDDGAFLTGYHLTGDKMFLDVAVRTADKLIADENPPGNWLAHPPANPRTGILHPRNGFWWGRPMWMVHQATGDQRYLDCCRRVARWYVGAMRLDGGMFRDTGIDFRTPSFGHATSGIACAVSLWCDLIREYGDLEWREPLRRALGFCYAMQFEDPQDMNLRGAILEKVIHPNRHDLPPWYLRDVGTFFYIQAVCKVLNDIPEVLLSQQD